jgi:hypothetical protein
MHSAQPLNLTPKGARLAWWLKRLPAWTGRLLIRVYFLPSWVRRTAMLAVLLVVVVGALLLAGCTTASYEDAAVATGLKKYDTITFNRGQFFKTWNSLSVTYAVAMYQLRVACAQGENRRLDADLCQNLDRIDDRARLVNDHVTAALATPEATIDFDQIMKYAQVGMDLALKLGVKAVLPLP